MITRRAALKGLVLGGGAVALAQTTAGSHITKRGLVAPASTSATPKPLAIPALMRGELQAGTRTYDLRLAAGVSRFFDGIDTPTWGINGPYLGPTLRMRAGERVRLNVSNQLGEQTTLHWHGLHLPAQADGGPHQIIDDGATWSPEFEVRQRAATFWYHSHMVPRTGPQVYYGLAGLIDVTDETSAKLDLPSDYGVDDVPLILQDRAFNQDGSLSYALAMPNVMMGMRGNVMLVNGTVNPYFEARSQQLRLRILNGSNARFYNLRFSDGRTFSQIASDGGLLEQPHLTQAVSLAPGERAQIMVDLSDGRPVTLRAHTVQNMTGMMGMMRDRMMGDNSIFDVLTIQPDEQRSGSAALPERLIELERPDPENAAGTRRFVLQMTMGPGMMMGGGEPFAINGATMDMNRINETVRVGTSEIWQIENASMMAHPFHIHDVQFRILDRNGVPPSPGEAGLKDTVVVAPRERVRLLLRFADYSDPDWPYMYHCHILEHEDAGMMGQFVVTS